MPQTTIDPALIRKTKPFRDFQDHFYVSMRHRYAFHTVGKAANSTVKQIFYKLDLEGTRYLMPSVHDRMASPLLSPFQLHQDDLDRVLTGDEFFRFTFVRNPFSRILSCYLDRIKDHKSRPYNEIVRFMGKPAGHQPSFAEFVEAICAQTVFQQNNHWRVQYYDTLANLVSYHAVGRQEDFARDVGHIYRRITGRTIGAEETGANASPSRTAAGSRLGQYWTSDLCKRFVEVYAADFDHFGYSPVLAE